VRQKITGPVRLGPPAWSVIVGLLCITLTGPVFASNLGFLKDAPITRFTGPDLELFNSNLRQALDQTADGDVHRWSNPQSGSAGEIALIRSYDQDGTRCRRTRISNQARGYSEAKTDAVFCKQPDGSWKVRTPSRAKSTGSD
jgi:hypothetical protein